MTLETRFFVRTFRRTADKTLETADLIELASEADAVGAVDHPLRLEAGAVALALHISDDVEITLLTRSGEIPEGLARLYGP